MASKLSPNGTQQSEQHHVTVSMISLPQLWYTVFICTVYTIVHFTVNVFLNLRCDYDKLLRMKKFVPCTCGLVRMYNTEIMRVPKFLLLGL